MIVYLFKTHLEPEAHKPHGNGSHHLEAKVRQDEFLKLFRQANLKERKAGKMPTWINQDVTMKQPDVILNRSRCHPETTKVSSWSSPDFTLYQPRRRPVLIEGMTCPLLLGEGADYHMKAQTSCRGGSQRKTTDQMLSWTAQFTKMTVIANI